MKTSTLIIGLCGFLGLNHISLATPEMERTEAYSSLNTKTVRFIFSEIKKAGVIHYSVYCGADDYSTSGSPNSRETAGGLLSVKAMEKVVLPVTITTRETHCALLFYIDENGNEKLDQVPVIGIPREGVGFSKLTQKPFSKPSFADTCFELATTDTMTANVFYY